ncbi:MAG: GAF domain-containing protein [Thermoplasmata archaeon YP2-bin.285]|uniref:GAF domain-containing protein n=1 Tax=Candidatus Sysuiplasma superficiale TaxID=2823368 RepID=A0A8J7YK24_9ARCH|nr:GAF domain-containing protein [Candidatus Sysuiplasma superficiale]
MSIAVDDELPASLAHKHRARVRDILRKLVALLSETVQSVVVSVLLMESGKPSAYIRGKAKGQCAEEDVPAEIAALAHSSLAASAEIRKDIGKLTMNAMPFHISGDLSGVLLTGYADNSSENGQNAARIAHSLVPLLETCLSIQGSDGDSSLLCEEIDIVLDALSKTAVPKAALLNLGTHICERFSFDGISVSSVRHGLAERMWSTGRDPGQEHATVLSAAMSDAVSTISTRRLLLKDATARGEIHCSIVPVVTAETQLAVVILSGKEIGVTAELLTAYAYKFALTLFEKSMASYSFSEGWLETIEKVFSALTGKSTFTMLEVLGSIFSSLLEAGYFSDYSIYPDGASLHQSEMNAEKVSVPFISSVWARESILDAYSSPASCVHHSTQDRKVLFLTIPEGRDRRWVVAITLHNPLIFESEVTLWRRFYRLFLILLDSYLMKIDRNAEDEISAHRRSMEERASLAMSSISQESSVREMLISACGFISQIGAAEFAAYSEEGGIYRKFHGSSAERDTLTRPFVELILSSSRMLNRFLSEVKPGAVSYQSEGADGASSYILSVYGDNRYPSGFILFHIPSDTVDVRTFELQMMNIAVAINMNASSVSFMSRHRSEEQTISLLGTLIRASAGSEGIEKVMQMTADAAAEMSNSPVAGIVIYSLTDRREVLSAYHGVAHHSSLKNLIAKDIAGRALKSGAGEILNSYNHTVENGKTDEGDAFTVERMAIVPLLMDIRYRGYIVAINTADGLFNESHLGRLTMLSQMASITFKLDLEAARRNKLIEDFNVFHSAEIALNSARSLNELYDIIAVELKRITGASGVILASEISGVKRVIRSTEEKIEVGSAVFDGSVIGMQFDHAPLSARIVEHLRLEEEWSSRIDAAEMILVRLPPSDNLVLSVYNGHGSRKFTNDDIDRLNKFSKIASSSLEKLNLIETLDRKLKHVEMMQTILKGITEKRSEYEVLSDIIPKAVEICDGDAGLFWKHDSLRQKNIVAGEFYRNKESENLVGFEMDADKGITGIVFRNKRPVIVADANLDNFAVQLEGTKKEQFETLIAAPVMVRNDVLGVLIIYRDRQPSFTASDLKTLVGISEDISSALAGNRTG